MVGLGFGMNLHEVIRVGRSGFYYTLVQHQLHPAAPGWPWQLCSKLSDEPAFLISTGTAICGGSAIAAVGPITHASDEEMAISLGTVFVLNSVALLTFPFLGAALHLTQTQFGLWAALAIHDTSSVVGAAAKYGAVALAVGTTVKLARALWIVPVALATAVVRGAKAKIQMAVVYRLFLPGGGLQFLSAHRRSHLWATDQTRENWLDGDSLPDRQRHLHRHPERSRSSPSGTGNRSLAAGLNRVAVADSSRMDRAVSSVTMKTRIIAAIRKIPRGKVSTYGAVARAAGHPELHGKSSECCDPHSDSLGSACLAQEEKSSFVVIPPSSSGCAWKPKA